MRSQNRRTARHCLADDCGEAFAPRREHEALGCIVEGCQGFRPRDPSLKTDPTWGQLCRQTPQLGAVVPLAHNQEVGILVLGCQRSEGLNQRTDSLHTIVKPAYKQEVAPCGIQSRHLTGHQPSYRLKGSRINRGEDDHQAFRRNSIAARQHFTLIPTGGDKTLSAGEGPLSDPASQIFLWSASSMPG